MNAKLAYLVRGRGIVKTTERTRTPTPVSKTVFLLTAEKLSLLLGSHKSMLSPIQAWEGAIYGCLWDGVCPQKGAESRVSRKAIPSSTVHP